MEWERFLLAFKVGEPLSEHGFCLIATELQPDLID